MIYARELLSTQDMEPGGAHLPVGGGQGDAREQPAVARGLVGREADVLVGADDGVAAKVPPAALHVRVEIRLRGVRGCECEGVVDLQARDCECAAVCVSIHSVAFAARALHKTYRNGLDIRILTQPQAAHARQAAGQQAQARPWFCEQHGRTVRAVV